MKRLLLSFFLLAALLNTPAQGMEVKVSVSHFRPNLLGEYVAGNLMDNNATTVWASSALNNGVGSWFEVEFPEVITLRDVTIYNGHHGGEFQDFARIKAGRFVFSDGSEQHFELEDGAAARVVPLWQVPTKSLRVEVDAIYPEQPGKSMSLAVSEVKFTAVKGDGVPRAMPEGGVLGELSRIIRDFYARQTTMDEGFLQYFPKAKQEEEAFGFEVFKQMQMQIGTYDDLKRAVVDTGDMKFRLMKFENGAAEVHSFGHYSLAVGDKMIGIPDDSVFTLRKEDGEWKIFDIRDYAAF
ncbi:discoidin domain-containing protein [Salidesulfovibrio onnuriiensis]|uniref:discoidin domain-containing protein n=1 Tax=Salidesulfovibrio onnuriiensis TaxID=2583823 RepID=UPI0011C9E0EF|nr:discoidin domain-containing protein [Salidesulfovibrio onnuriiensis]